MGLFSILRSFLALVGAVGVAIVVISAVGKYTPALLFERAVLPDAEVVNVDAPQESEIDVDTEKNKVSAAPKAPPEKLIQEAAPAENKEPSVSAIPYTAVADTAAPGWEFSRIEKPYSMPPRPFSEINTEARAALVNIFCQPYGALSPITASGVFISSNGVILTNAHVAQYVLLAQSGKLNLRCFIRTGAPAREQWLPKVLYVPPAWVREHAHELNNEKALGTGEHDWALLYAAETADGSTLPSSFSHLPFDVRTGIAFTDDQILIASYPAGFLGGMAANSSLYPASSITTVRSLLTFNAGTPDVMSLGGSITAQSGSSGGAVVNAWGYIVGLVTTMSDAETTDKRDLRSLAMSYINADSLALTGLPLQTVIGGDLNQKAYIFMGMDGAELTELLINQLK